MMHSFLITLVILAIFGILLFKLIKKQQSLKNSEPDRNIKGTISGIMKRVHLPTNESDAFVFDDLYVVDIEESYTCISLFREHDLLNKEIKYPRIRECPKIIINKLGTPEFTSLLAKKLFSFSKSAKNLGTVKHNDDYSVCADGAYWRRIEHIRVDGELNNVNLRLSISISASPVENLVASQPPGSLSASDKKHFVFSRNFIIPVNDIQDFFKISVKENRTM